MTGPIQARIFVVGCPRSGTTLLQSIIGSHPRIRAFPESHFFAHAASAPFDDGLRYLNEFLASAGLPPQSADDRKDAVALFVEALDAAALSARSDIWSEKTPRHLHHIGDIRTRIPRARFVHILRNGAEVVPSLHRVSAQWGEKPRSIAKCVRRWDHDVSISLGYLNQPNHYFIRYESLVTDTTSVVDGLCGFLNVPFDAEMIGSRAEGARAVTLPHETWKKEAAEPISRSPRVGVDPEIVDAVAKTQRLLDESLPALEPSQD